MVLKAGKMYRPTDVLQFILPNTVFVVEQRNHRVSRWNYTNNFFDFKLSAGEVSENIKINGGSGYLTPPTVTYSAPDSDIAEPIQATGIASLMVDEVVGIILTEPGNGYSVAPTITFDNTNTGGTGAEFEAVLGNLWGSNANGTSGIPGTSVTADDDHFNFPTGIAFFNDLLYVTDTFNHRIRVLDFTTGNFVDSIGSPGTQGGAGNIQFYRPTFINHNGDTDTLLVTDSRNSRIVAFNDMSPYTFIGFSNGTFHTPSGVAVPFDFDFNYYSDSVRSVVEQYADDGITFVQTIGSPGTDPNVPSQLFYPGNGHGDNDAPNFFPIIADTRNNNIKSFDPSGNFTNEGNLLPGTSDGKLYWPSSVSGVLNGVVNYFLVANTLNNRIDAFTGGFTFVTTFGSP